MQASDWIPVGDVGMADGAGSGSNAVMVARGG